MKTKTVLWALLGLLVAGYAVLVIATLVAKPRVVQVRAVGASASPFRQRRR